jgi:hypothetical protein
MQKTANKARIVTFKADDSLLGALEGVENRSEFIRSAVLAALENICPLCKGRGILTPNQRNHWTSFASDHELAKCGDCHEVHLVCVRGSRRRVRHAR